MNNSQSFFNCSFVDNNTNTSVQIAQQFDHEDITWLELAQQFNRLLHGAGFVAPKFTQFLDTISFDKGYDLPTQTEQAA